MQWWHRQGEIEYSRDAESLLKAWKNPSSNGNFQQPDNLQKQLEKPNRANKHLPEHISKSCKIEEFVQPGRREHLELRAHLLQSHPAPGHQGQHPVEDEEPGRDADTSINN